MIKGQNEMMNFRIGVNEIKSVVREWDDFNQDCRCSEGIDDQI